ncbi:MAG TPA: T9SS type A sorting domain-containing protein, partial [Saprospiraceae bacterium]|nr:T9SS type A sorting domain-containing protein [Saprospiraceae bacterium]
LGVNVMEQVFEVSPDACYKIYRNFTVINWCTYRPQDPNWDGSGIWTHTQVVKVIESTPPTIRDCADKVIGVESDCKAPFTIKNSAVDLGICATESLSWVVEIDLWANGDVDYKYGFNENGEFKINPVSNGQEISITLPERVQVGRHKIKWSVRDKCGNFGSCHTIVETKDLKKPTPYMHEFLTAAFQGNVMDFMVSPRLFNINSFDNCTPQSKLRYSFSPNVNDTLRTINCSNAGFQFYTIYITDLAGNQESVEAFLLLFDNGSCSMTATFPGTVTESNGANMPNVSMSLMRQGQNEKITSTNEIGQFGWENISLYSDYQIMPDFNQVQTGRVDIADLKKLQNYLFGRDTLVDFEFMAADLNRDNKIRINDLNVLRENILRPSQNSTKMWRFAVDVSEIKAVSDLSKVKEVFDIMKFDGSIDFTAVYMGDITGANKKDTDLRSTIEVVDQVKGNEYQLTLNEDINTEGVELIFEVNPALIDEMTVSSPYFEVTNTSLTKDKANGIIKIVMLKDVEIQTGKPFIAIATSAPLLEKSDILVQQNSKILLPNYHTVTLRNSKKDVESLIWSIMPNPSNNGRFMIDAAQVIDKISIFDVHGREVSFTQDGQYLNMDAMPGVYVITISAKGEKSSKKAIITN